MPVTLPRAQRTPLNTDYLDAIGSNEDGAVPLPETVKAIYQLAAEFIDTAVDNLIKSDRNSTGDLADMRPVIVESGVVNIIDIYVKNYYKYVDKGVRGWQDREGSGSPYAFKPPRKGRGGGKSKMVTAIRKWVIREGIAARNTKKAINARENRRLQIKDTSTSTAIFIAGSIRKKGLRRTNFFTDAVRTLEDKLGRGVANALRIDVIETLK